MLAGSGKQSLFDEKGTLGDYLIDGVVAVNTLLRFFT